jgi:fluoride exporter
VESQRVRDPMTQRQGRSEDGAGPRRGRVVSAVALGGALGAVLRWSLSEAVSAVAPMALLPWGTLIANGAGSLLLGHIDRTFSHRPAHLRAFWATGVCGGFTTFSLFSAEVVALVRAGSPGVAGTYALASVVVAVSGIEAGRRWGGLSAED